MDNRISACGRPATSSGVMHSSLPVWAGAAIQPLFAAAPPPVPQHVQMAPRAHCPTPHSPSRPTFFSSSCSSCSSSRYTTHELRHLPTLLSSYPPLRHALLHLCHRSSRLRARSARVWRCAPPAQVPGATTSLRVPARMPLRPRRGATREAHRGRAARMQLQRRAVCVPYGASLLSFICAMVRVLI